MTELEKKQKGQIYYDTGSRVKGKQQNRAKKSDANL